MSKPTPSLIANQKPAKPAAAAQATKAAGPLRWYRVESADKVIRMPGAAEFVIRQGKEISSAEYDIALLRNRGVKLTEIETPGWYAEAQERSAAKHAELEGRGIQMPEHPPEWSPPAVAAQQPS